MAGGAPALWSERNAHHFSEGSNYLQFASTPTPDIITHRRVADYKEKVRIQFEGFLAAIAGSIDTGSGSDLGRDIL